jgi:hypothetical protein
MLQRKCEHAQTMALGRATEVGAACLRHDTRGDSVSLRDTNRRPESQSRFSKLLEEFHDSRNVLRVEAERVHCSRLASSIPILERYIEGRASWVFDVQAPFKLNKVGKGDSGTPCTSSVHLPLLIFQVDIANGGIVNHWDKEPVLVSDVEFVHGPNGKITFVMRLYLCHYQIEELRRGDVYLQLPQRRFDILRSSVGGKFGTLPTFGGHQSSHGFKPSMIESALQIMDRIPNDCREIVEGLPIFDVCKVTLDELASSVRLHIGPTDQSFFQAVNAKFNVRDVLVSPFDLETGTFAGRHISP